MKELGIHVPQGLTARLREAFPPLVPTEKTTMVEVYIQAGIEKVLQRLQLEENRRRKE